MMSHTNEPGLCPKCEELFDAYPGFHEELRTWFNALRVEHPEAHISKAGRGKVEQDALFARGATRARYGQSAHNVNAALDLWENREGVYTLSQIWFHGVIAPALYPSLEWYGKPGSSFYELPHVELKNWKDLVSSGQLKPVE